MKTIKAIAGVIACLMFMPNFSNAQNMGEGQMYWVHEDNVRPGMGAEHEKVDKQLISEFKKHDIKINWLALTSENGTYRYVLPIKDMNEIQNNQFATLMEKMGKDAFENMMNGYNKSTNSQGDYLISLDEELTYMPDGFTQTPEGENYRRFTNYTVSPANMAEFRKKAIKVKEMFKTNNSQLHYRVYQYGFGMTGKTYMVAMAAKNSADLESRINESGQKMGEDFQKLLGELNALADDIEIEYGWTRPEISMMVSN